MKERQSPMRIRIPRFTWIKVVDEDGKMLRQVCTQEEVFVITEDDIKRISDSENPPTFDTMVAAREK